MNTPAPSEKEYQTRIDLCDGKYTIICDLRTGQFEALRHGERWRSLVGDKMILAMFDKIIELREKLADRDAIPDEVRVPRDWMAIVTDKTAACDVDTMSETVERVFDTLSKGGTQSIDLRGLNEDGVNAEHLCAVLRCTYMWRDEILGWREALGVAERALPKVGISPQDALCGLLADAEGES